jgi:dihydrolipoamide dehydrogenase
VGAAATGCQLASIFSDFGSQVWLLETAPRILNTEDEVVSQAITAAFERDGIEVLTGIAGLERIDQANGHLQLSYREDGKVEVLAVDAVITAVGWVGYGDSLNLAAAGVQTERGFITVNDCLQSSAPHIYAAGDINGRMMLVQSAGYEARLAVENALLGHEERNRHKIVPHGGFTDPEYGSVGLTETEAAAAGPYAMATVPYADLDRAVIDGYTDGQCKLIVSPETRQILGAHVAGEQAVEVVQLVATGMAAGMRVEQLAELELAYPTYTAIVGLAARRLVRELGVIPLAREWHTLRRAAEWEQPSLS